MLRCLSYDENLTCAGKPWPSLIHRWIKPRIQTLWDRHMSASKCRILRFDPPLDVPGSVLSSARQIRLKRHTCDRMVRFFSTLDKRCHFVRIWNVTFRLENVWQTFSELSGEMLKFRIFKFLKRGELMWFNHVSSSLFFWAHLLFGSSFYF